MKTGEFNTEKQAQQVLENILKNMKKAESFDRYAQLLPEFDEVYTSDCNYRSPEHIVVSTAIKHPKLYPLMVKVVNAIIEFNYNEKPMWENDEEQAGAHFARELALCDRKYIPLYAHYLTSNDLNHEVYQQDDYMDILKKWHKQWDKELFTLVLARLFTPSQYGYNDVEYTCTKFGLAKSISQDSSLVYLLIDAMKEGDKNGWYGIDEEELENYFAAYIYPDNESKQQELLSQLSNFRGISDDGIITDKDDAYNMLQLLPTVDKVSKKKQTSHRRLYRKKQAI